MNPPRLPDPLITVTALPAFNDNYIWVLRRGMHVAVVDPGDAAPVLNYLQRTEADLVAVLITHHHADHCGGIGDLLGYAGEQVPVYGPAGERITGVSHAVTEGDEITLTGLETCLNVLAVPGHTAHHIAYYGRSIEPDGALFCGDTLFGAGCGRLFEGTPAQMHASLAKIAVLPAPTLIYCAHEYTEANLRFAMTVEPANEDLQARAQSTVLLRSAGQPTVPSTLQTELATNPFLRCDSPSVRAAAQARLGHEPADAIATFAAIRQWKNEFK